MDDESLELERLNKRIQPVRDVAGKLSPAGIISTEIIRQAAGSVIQTRHSIIPEAEYRSREAPSYRDHFKPIHPKLPDVKSPTDVRIFYVEDGVGNMDKHSPYHGAAAAATGSAAWQALTGEEHMPAVMINRMPYEDKIGFKRITSLSDPQPREFTLDMAQPLLQGKLKQGSYRVISTSTSSFNNKLRTFSDREKGVAALTRYFGDNTIFIQSSGNYTNGLLSHRHSAYTNHPSTLTIGATQSRVNPGKTPFRSQSLESYSSFGPDIVFDTNPPAANYAIDRFSKPAHQKIDGTSFSCPQAASITGALLRRFARSKENPQAVLEKEDVLFALKHTAIPVHTQQLGGFLAFGQSQPLHQQRIGGRLVSEEAGNGRIDTQSAWELLERMETKLHEKKAEMKPRHHVIADIKIDPHTKLSAGRFFHYPITIRDKLHAESIIIDIDSPPVAQTYPNGVLQTSLFLKSPKGEMIRLYPSVNTDSGYLIARVPGIQGEAMEGEWQLVSQEPIWHARMHFNNAMEPGHVALTVQPDMAKRERELFRMADFDGVDRITLDNYLTGLSTPGKPVLASHDFSQTVFPKGYMEMRLLAAMAKGDKALAEGMVKSGYAPFKEKESELIAAINKGNAMLTADIITPSAQDKINLLRGSLVYEKPEMTFMLGEIGFGNVKEPITGNSALAIVAQHEDGKVQTSWRNSYKPEVLEGFIAAIEKHNVDIEARDSLGQRAFDKAASPSVRAMLASAASKRAALAEADKAMAASMEEQVAQWTVPVPKENIAIKDAAALLQSLGVELTMPFTHEKQHTPFVKQQIFSQPGLKR